MQKAKNSPGTFGLFIIIYTYITIYVYIIFIKLLNILYIYFIYIFSNLYTHSWPWDQGHMLFGWSQSGAPGQGTFEEET